MSKLLDWLNWAFDWLFWLFALFIVYYIIYKVVVTSDTTLLQRAVMIGAAYGWRSAFLVKDTK